MFGIALVLYMHYNDTILEGMLPFPLIIEKVLAIKGTGIQIDTLFKSGKTQTLFINLERIEGVIINEGITCGRIICYMAIIVDGMDELITFFEDLPLDVLKDVWKGMTNIMDE